MFPSPNRACTFQRTRLSILGYVPEAYCVISQHSHDLVFGMEHKDCLPSPQRLAFDRVTTSYTLADPSKPWLLNLLQANVGYNGDSVTIQVAELNQHTSLGNPAFQHD